MNRKIILSLLIILFVSCFTTVFAYDSNDFNKRITSCTPSKNLEGSGSTLYQISGLTGSICIFKIQYRGFGNKPDIICKVPASRMSEMTSYNPMAVQGIKNKYCVMSIKSLKKAY